MLITEKIIQLANNIRSKIYGVEVRESIAQGIEAAGSIADEANTRSKITQDEMVSIIRPAKNIFSTNNLTDGRVNSFGTITVDGTNNTSDFEVIDRNETYITNISIFTAQYDGNRNFIKYLFVPQGSTFLTEPDAQYIRISVDKTKINLLQVEKGVQLTDYEKYYKTLIGVDFREIIESRKSDVKNFQFIDLKERFEDIERDVASIQPTDETLVEDDIAENVFITEMNKKAGALGCEHLNFKNPNGLVARGMLISAKDMMLITRHAAGIPKLVQVWGAKNYNVIIKGGNPRTVNIKTTVADAGFEQDYTILGGKTGTLGIIKNLCIVAEHKASGRLLAGTVFKANRNRWVAMKQLLDETIKILDNNGSASPVISAASACSIVLSEHPLLYTNAPLKEIFALAETDVTSPASTTKILTSIILTENIADLNESFILKTRDMQEDSISYNDGDRITFKDALYLMMLPSSNTVAKAVARVVGQKIIKTRGYVN